MRYRDLTDKVIAVLIGAGLAFAIMGLVGCSPSHNGEPTKNAFYDITVETVRGHDYVVYDGYYSGGIIHAAHCPCLTTTGGKK